MPASAVQSLKLTLVSALGLSKDALHLHVGLAVFVLALVIFRLPMKSILPWLGVLVLACVGELADMRDDLASLGHWRWMASLHDVINTIFWPTVFFMLARFSRLLTIQKRGPGSPLT